MQGTLRLPGHRAPPAAEETAAPTVRTGLKAAPAIRSVYWCEFPADMRFPEFWKTRPVVVISYKNALSGPILVVPMTTAAQPDNRWAVKLAKNPNPRNTSDVWVVCNHLYTVACSRLSTFGGTVPRLGEAEFRTIHDRILQWIPKPVSLDANDGTP